MKYLARAGSSLMSTPPQTLAKWGGWAVVALMPGSFVVLPLLWLARQLRAQTSRE